MLSGVLDFFTGADKKVHFEEHVIPVVQHSGRPLTYTDCFLWLNRKVVLLLKKYDHPQIGTVKYIGSDDRGQLCAGVEFEYNINGMSGKVNGQKLFKCKSGHGLLIPVEFVRLLEDYENGTNIFPAQRSNSLASSAHINRTQSVPNLSARTVRIEDYTPLTLNYLEIGNNVVWLGGSTPQTGIVKWIGRTKNQTPIKVWMEMDDYMGFGLTEIDIGTKFGCAPGRGKFLPVEELILLENFLPRDNELNNLSDTASANFSGTSGNPAEEPAPVVNSTCLSSMPVINNEDCQSANAKQDLIDFSDGHETVNNEQQSSLFVQDFNKILNTVDENATLVKNDTGNTAQLIGNNTSTSDILREFSPLEFEASAPPQTPTSTMTPVSNPPSPPVIATDLEQNSKQTVDHSQQSAMDVDVNGNLPEQLKKVRFDTEGGILLSGRSSIKLVDDQDSDYLPPFIIPPINIVEFFKAEGLKGIQGKRNSCYIDVVLFSMFAFTDTFDPYFLVKNNLFNKVPDSAVTKTAKKILSEQIVNPLRQNYYCSAAGVNYLREIMIPFSDKLDGAFMDIEEFMLLMFDKVFQLREFITYDNGVKDYLHQLNLSAPNPVMTVKQCLEMSMADYNLKLQSVPSPAFIIQIPRHYSGIIQSTTIIPSLSLDLDTLLKPTDNHRASSVMHLVAVICINDFHFVTFVKCGKGSLSHWVLFDSNPSEERPKIEIVTNMGEWLESLEHQCLTDPRKVAENKHKLSPYVQRLLNDIYVCIYSPM